MPHTSITNLNVKCFCATHIKKDTLTTKILMTGMPTKNLKKEVNINMKCIAERNTSLINYWRQKVMLKELEKC